MLSTRRIASLNEITLLEVSTAPLPATPKPLRLDVEFVEEAEKSLAAFSDLLAQTELGRPSALVYAPPPHAFELDQYTAVERGLQMILRGLHFKGELHCGTGLLHIHDQLRTGLAAALWLCFEALDLRGHLPGWALGRPEAGGDRERRETAAQILAVSAKGQDWGRSPKLDERSSQQEVEDRMLSIVTDSLKTAIET